MSAQMVTLTIDGKEVTVPAGTLIIRAAEQLGHRDPAVLRPPAAGPGRRLPPVLRRDRRAAQAVHVVHHTVAPGMVVMTQNTSPQVEDAQVANLEFLLLEPPARLPDLRPRRRVPAPGSGARRSGRGRAATSRRSGRTRSRSRSRRSSAWTASGASCAPDARGSAIRSPATASSSCSTAAPREQVGIAPGEDFRSPFSGNTIQICPVGALTATPYRFVARPFDLSSVDTVCPHCSAGCNIKLDMRRGEVVRQLARDNLEVNDAWLCDKGRFAFRFPDDARPDDHAADPRSRAGAGVVRRGADRGRRHGAPASASRS